MYSFLSKVIEKCVWFMKLVLLRGRMSMGLENIYVSTCMGPHRVPLTIVETLFLGVISEDVFR